MTSQHDDSFDVCFNSGASGGVRVVTASFWNVTKLLGRSVVWKPLITATGILTGGYGISEPGMTVTTTSTYVVFDANFLAQFHVTMRMGSSAGGIRFSWSSAIMSQVISLQLFPVSRQV